MPALHRVGQQFAELYRSLTASQRITLLVVPLLVVVGLYYVIASHSAADHVPLSWGKVFTLEELAQAEQALLDAGLNDFRRQGQRLLVPTGDVERYNAALQKSGALSESSMIELERQLSTANVFTSGQELALKNDIALKKELAKQLRAVDWIENADVTWARPAQRRLRGPAAVTATVSIVPKKNHEITAKHVASIRHAVAAAVPDLTPDRVVVFDQSSGTAFTADAGASSYEQMLEQKRKLEQEYYGTISAALAYIPDVQVTVHAHVDDAGRAVDVASTSPEATLDATAAVQVSIGIPFGYYEQIASGQGVSPGTTDAERAAYDEEIARLQASVAADVKRVAATLIKPHVATAHADDAVSVVTVYPVSTKKHLAVSTAAELRALVDEWGGLAAVCILGACGLWLVHRSLTSSRDHTEFDPSESSSVEVESEPIGNLHVEIETNDDPQIEPNDALQDFAAFSNRWKQSPGPDSEPRSDHKLRNEEMFGRPAQVHHASAASFEFLDELGEQGLTELLTDERPQVIALVLSQLPPQRAANVLDGLSAAQQVEVIRRVAHLQDISPDVIRDVADSMQKKMSAVPANERQQSGGPRTAARILHVANRFANQGIIETLKDSDPGLFDDLEQRLLAFDDLMHLDGNAIRVLFEKFEPDEWAIALKGASESIRLKILEHLSPRIAERLNQETENLGPVRISEVEVMQKHILDALRQSVQLGEIDIPVGSID